MFHLDGAPLPGRSPDYPRWRICIAAYTRHECNTTFAARSPRAETPSAPSVLVHAVKQIEEYSCVREVGLGRIHRRVPVVYGPETTCRTPVTGVPRGAPPRSWRARGAAGRRCPARAGALQAQACCCPAGDWAPAAVRTRGVGDDDRRDENWDGRDGNGEAEKDPDGRLDRVRLIIYSLNHTTGHCFDCGNSFPGN